MVTTSACWRAFRVLFIWFGPLLAVGVACNGGPVGPTFDKLPGIYTGRWPGNINGWEVVLDVQAEPGNVQRWIPVGLNGVGTALQPVTGESHRVTLRGQTAGGNSTSFNLAIATITGPGGVILSGGLGLFSGSVAGDGRTWPGRFSSSTAGPFEMPIFGRGDYAVTLIKD